MEAVHCSIAEALQIGYCRVAGHQHIAEGIHGGLDDDIGDGEHGTLNACRQADTDDFSQLRAINPHF